MFRRAFLIASVWGAMAAIPAFATQGTAPKPLGRFGMWHAYAFVDKGETVCYMSLEARGSAIRKLRRGPVTLMITQRPAENTRDVVSYESGYSFKPSSDLKIAVGKSGFSLFTNGDTAWSRDAMTDHDLTTAILKSSVLTAVGQPAHAAGAVTDTISLKGAAEAYRAAARACGMEVEEPAKPRKSHKKTSR